MLETLIKSSKRRKVLALFALNPQEELYARQVAQELEESPYAVGLELHHLTAGSLLEAKRKGRLIYYQWNQDCPGAHELQSLLRKLHAMHDRELAVIPNLARQRKLSQNLKSILVQMKESYKPDKIILFGSLASGKVREQSDIDLVVIKKTSLPYTKRVQQLIDLLDYDVDVDFFTYTPKEFEQALQQRPFFKKEIAEKGQVLYEKTA